MESIKITNGLLKMMLFAMFAALAIHPTPATVFTILGVLVLLSFTLKKEQGAAYGIVIETWANYIIERFWKDNQFLRFAYDDSDKVLAGRIVHIPQPGSKPVVVKNR